MEGKAPYAGLAAARQKSPDDFRVEIAVVPADLPDWLPGDIVGERVH